MLEKLTLDARKQVRTYLRSSAFQGFILKATRKPAWWNIFGWWFYQQEHLKWKERLEPLTREGQLAIGIVLMQNSLLSKKKNAVAPALVLGSFDFSARGFLELEFTAMKMAMSQQLLDPAASAEVEGVFADQEYQIFRKRPLPPAIEAPGHIFLFDELIRSDDRISIGEGMEAVAILSLHPPGKPSLVLPRKLAADLVEPIARDLASMPRPVESDNVNLVRSDDQAMGEAIAKARATLPRALATIAEGRGEGFTVKFPVEDNGEVEHFWLSNTVIHHDHFSGTQEEEATTVTNVQAGQPFSVPASEISDWMFVRGGKMHGNFTLRAMLPSMPPEQRARYEPHLAPEDDI